MNKSKNTNSKKVETKKQEEKVETFELIVDSNDSYQNDLNAYYTHPSRLSLVKHLNDKIFDGVLIKNTQVDSLTSMNLLYVLKKMKVNSFLNVVISQPLSVMQSYDAKQVEANLKLAGFDKITIEDHEDENTKIKTLAVKASRPEKNPNVVEVELEKVGNNKVTAKVK